MHGRLQATPRAPSRRRMNSQLVTPKSKLHAVDHFYNNSAISPAKSRTGRSETTQPVGPALASPSPRKNLFAVTAEIACLCNAIDSRAPVCGTTVALSLHNDDGQ